MKLSLVCLFFLFFLTPETSLAQSTPARPTSEQSLQELVKEVRQLRATLQHINSAMYKGQLMLERLKLQQEQVSRIWRELNETRDRLGEMRAQQIKLKELLGRVETGVEVGMKHPGELAGIKAEFDSVNQREQRMSIRETQLANELEVERAKLNELNERLNALELEIAPK
jgi:chromosome segregation ATPase